jgi:hypothetical protein
VPYLEHHYSLPGPKSDRICGEDIGAAIAVGNRGVEGAAAPPLNRI